MRTCLKQGGKRLRVLNFTIEGYHFYIQIYITVKGKVGSTCSGKSNKPQKEYNKEWREKAFIYLGGKCKRCGETDWRVLQINHLNNDGKTARKKNDAAMCKDIVDNQRKDVELLCANCNIRYMYETKQRKRWV